MTNDNLFVQADKVFGPARELNRLALRNMEKLVDIQIASMKSFSKLGLDSMKAALDVNDVAGLQDYTSKQREIAQEVMKMITDDAKAVAELGNVYFADARKMFQDGVAAATKKAA